MWRSFPTRIYFTIDSIEIVRESIPRPIAYVGVHHKFLSGWHDQYAQAIFIARICMSGWSRNIAENIAEVTSITWHMGSI